MDNEVNCFNYIVNTQKTYDLLGEAVKLFQKRIARRRYTANEELAEVKDHYLANGSALWSMWLRKVREAIQLAREDYKEFFSEESPRMKWLSSVSEAEVMRTALDHRDWWIKEES